jgi:chemosensory pili system protein ChpA (sensor histidine kinase/response regulator)
VSKRDGDRDDGRVTGFSDESFNTSEYRALRILFRDESREALEQVAHHLLRAGPERIDPDALTELLRTTHSLKGTAGTVGLRDFADTAHRLEGVLERLRAGSLVWSAGVRDSIVEVVDGLRALADAGDDDIAAAELARHLGRALAAVTDGRGRAPDPVGDPDAIPDGDPDPSASASMTLRGPTDSSVHKSARRDEPAQLRVDPGRIDRLMDSVGELIFDRTRIERRVTELRGSVEQLALLRDAMAASTAASARSLVGELSDRIASLERLAAELLEDTGALRRTGNALQDGLTDIRMQSSRLLFQRLAPQVRALARAAGVPIRLITHGAETEFDKSVADQIVEPLIHLLRNAVAHGIEPPEVRRALGKPPEGHITLSARHEGQSVVIEVADDGAGVDPRVVRQRLVQSGRWSDSRAKVASDDEVLRALFDARVSSREEVDELAGRGIGLDAVRDTVVRLGGEIAVSSTVGVGTSFTMRLPQTTSISNALLFKVAGHVFAIPNVHVVDTARVEVSSPAIPAILRVRDGAVPLVLLHRVLGAALPADARSVPAVVIDYASRRLAVTCDKIVGPREIVVKNLGPLLSPLPLYAGGTISGSGKVQLILDPAALVRLAYPETTPGRAAGRVLVVDDSRVVREAMALVLERAGYQVDLADTGLAGWRMLGRAHYDALVTDLEMPEMGGLELIERVRGDALLSALPVVIISSRASEVARRRADGLGVVAVLAKPVQPDQLLAALGPR